MAKNTIIDTLPKDKQEALAFCGITQDVQLARTSPHALLKELETATALFPDTLRYQPELNRLAYICQKAAESVKLPETEAPSAWQGSDGQAMPTPGSARPQVEVHAPQARRFSQATGRMLVEQDIQKAISLDERRRKEDPRGFNHSICCTHPIATYLNAWVTWLLAISFVVLVLCVARLLIGIQFKGAVGVVLAVSIATIIITYNILLKMAICCTCRVSIFSFRRYPRNRKAHHIPLLGYTLATALSVIFFLRYRCPSCGTPQKLFGRRRHQKNKLKKLSKSHRR